MIRSAGLSDLPALQHLEDSSFEGDRISTRQFRYLLSKARARTLVSEQEGQVLGYVILLMNQACLSNGII